MKSRKDFLCKKDVNIFLTFKFCLITQFQAANLTLAKKPTSTPTQNIIPCWCSYPKMKALRKKEKEEG